MIGADYYTEYNIIMVMVERLIRVPVQISEEIILYLQVVLCLSTSSTSARKHHHLIRIHLEVVFTIDFLVVVLFLASLRCNPRLQYCHR